MVISVRVAEDGQDQQVRFRRAHHPVGFRHPATLRRYRQTVGARPL